MINCEVVCVLVFVLYGVSIGGVIFNFEGELLYVVVKVIFGDMFGQNYVIVLGVQGMVILVMFKLVLLVQVLNLLEMVLGWNNVCMVYSGGCYNIVVVDQVLVGMVVLSIVLVVSVCGFEVCVVLLQFIFVIEMKKVLELYVCFNVIVNVDSGCNVIIFGGICVELENYLCIVEIFDVDWLLGMLVGVFLIQLGKVEQVVIDLEKVFGEESKMFSVGMFCFLLLENVNVVLVIMLQVCYLDQIQQWLDCIDIVGGSVCLFFYELCYIKVCDLVECFSEVFVSSGNRGGFSLVLLVLGVILLQLGSDGDCGMDNNSSIFGLMLGGSSGSGSSNGSLNLLQCQFGNVSVSLEVEGDCVGVLVVEEINILLVCLILQVWCLICEVIEKLDVMLLQVYIEVQVVEVVLIGDLKYGVNWFFDNVVVGCVLIGVLVGLILLLVVGGLWNIFVGGVIGNDGVGWVFIGYNVVVVVSVLDKVIDLCLLQILLVFVCNNVEVMFNVGDKVLINIIMVNIGVGISIYSLVQYIDMGVIFKVCLCVICDGMVFLDIVQEVSSVFDVLDVCNLNECNCNLCIFIKKLLIEVVVQSGDIIMLVGLIIDLGIDGSSGIFGLSWILVVGVLFGQKICISCCLEVIVLLILIIVCNSQELCNLIDEYSKCFCVMELLNQLCVKK